jgi:hypothetical protein
MNHYCVLNTIILLVGMVTAVTIDTLTIRTLKHMTFTP